MESPPQKYISTFHFSFFKQISCGFQNYQVPASLTVKIIKFSVQSIENVVHMETCTVYTLVLFILRFQLLVGTCKTQRRDLTMKKRNAEKVINSENCFTVCFTCFF